MDGSRRSKPIDYLKNDVANILAEAAASSERLYLTKGNQPRLVLLDAGAFSQYEERIALLKVLALGQKEIE